MSLAEKLVDEALEKCYEYDNPLTAAECIVKYWRAVESRDCTTLSELPSGGELCRNPELLGEALEEYKEGLRCFIDDFLRVCKKLRGKYTRWACLETLIEVLNMYADVFTKALGAEEHRKMLQQAEKLRDDWIQKAFGGTPP
ncbi:MAG: hypothetical protein QXK07_07070 [Desulfurococcaceae archaeon]